MRHFREEDGVDPSWGRCCCYYGNRRGSRCVFAFDLVFIAHLIRFLCSWYACWKRKDPQRLAYKRYAKWRRWTFWIQAPLILAGLVGFIMDDVLNRGGLKYVISIFATIMVGSKTSFLQVVNPDIIKNNNIILRCIFIFVLMKRHECKNAAL